MAQRQSRSFTRSFLSASLVAILSTRAAASGVSTSVFPNSACSGASTSTGGLVGIGRVTLSTGEVETHCGCPTDNLPSFDACPSSPSGESVCNSILNLDTGAFTASCGIVACQGFECPSTVVNTVIVDDEDCFTSGKGSLGFVTIDGESKCACSSEADDFTECRSPENGRASCIAVDGDFLGMSLTHTESVRCGVVCDTGFALTAAGNCISLTKRAAVSGHHSPSAGGPSAHRPSHFPSKTHTGHHSPTFMPTSVPVKVGPSHSHHGASQSHHNHGPSHSIPIKVVPTPYSSRAGASQHHQHHEHHTSIVLPSGATKVGPSKGPSAAYPSASGGLRMKARSVEEFVFSADACAADERSCSAGVMGDFSCVRLDDVSECGGCHSDGNAVDCLALPGIQTAVCLKGGCVVRACATGFVQTSEGACSPKA